MHFNSRKHASITYKNIHTPRPYLATKRSGLENVPHREQHSQQINKPDAVRVQDDLGTAGLVQPHRALLDVADDGVAEQGTTDHADADEVETRRYHAVGQGEEDEAEAHEAGRQEVQGPVALALDQDAADQHGDELAALEDHLSGGGVFFFPEKRGNYS